jgi:hypothetical protein
MNQKHDYTKRIISYNCTTIHPQHLKKKITLNNNIIYINHSSPYNNQTQLETIVQWNINSYFKKLPDVHRIIADLQPSALYLQETNLNNNKNNPTLKNYKGYFKNHINYSRASGGVCIFVLSSLDHEIIPLNNSL